MGIWKLDIGEIVLVVFFNAGARGRGGDLEIGHWGDSSGDFFLTRGRGEKRGGFFCVSDSSGKPGLWRNILHVSFTGGLGANSTTRRRKGHAQITERTMLILNIEFLN